PHGALSRLLLRARHRPGLAARVLRVRQPGRPGGHGTRRVGAPRRRLRRPRARPAAAERRAAARRVPGLGGRAPRRCVRSTAPQPTRKGHAMNKRPLPSLAAPAALAAVAAGAAAAPRSTAASCPTVTDGQLTIGTDNPAFPPWFGGGSKTSK